MARESHQFTQALEVRESTGSPGRLVGVILPAGRVAGDRRELFVGAGVRTPDAGIALLPEHRSKNPIMRFSPIRGSDGSLSVDHLLPDTDAGRAAAQGVRDGSRAAMSVEFHALDAGVVQGVREVRESLIEAAALVPAGSYDQARAEVRSRSGRYRRRWL